MRLTIPASLLSLVASTAHAAPASWTAPQAPFRIVGNVYYVGTEGIAAYLIVDRKRMILIDGTPAESAGVVLDNIRTLGFDPKNLRYLLNNHAHWDHAGGLAAIRGVTRAKLVASSRDREVLKRGSDLARPDVGNFPPVGVDRSIGDGDKVRLGGTRLTAHLTPGHTKGCTSWSMTTTEGIRKVEILFACSLTVAGQNLINDRAYRQAAGDFRQSLATLKRMRADVFLTFHSEFFDMAGKRRRQMAGDRDAFIDPYELRRQVDRAEAAFDAELARQEAAVRPE
ncbi:subclass B3 metallo-beta-lactamase [Sphingomonas sp. ID0503]|uniref:subclass B3 metallo-beta-lactamase n=1 Tax=Sphingomonas sp. ID0503 TaxID=3399691 RepID=UPI003AFAC8BF